MAKPRRPKAFLAVGVRNRIEGFIDAEEGDRLAYYAGSVPSGRVAVELGTASGSGALFIAAGFRAASNPSHVHCFDPYELGPADHYAAGQYRDSLALDLLNARAAYVGVADAVIVHKKTSLDGAEAWARGAFSTQPIGLLHVDALHDFDHASEDVLAWAPLLAPGAVMVMHDLYGKRTGDVLRVVDEVVRPSGMFEEIGRFQWSRSNRRRGQWIGRKI